MVRAVGAWMTVSGLAHFIGALWLTFSQEFRFGSHTYAFTTPMKQILSMAIGLHLFFKGAWIAKKLIEVDNTKDP
jgi:hypothetical protein